MDKKVKSMKENLASLNQILISTEQDQVESQHPLLEELSKNPMDTFFNQVGAVTAAKSGLTFFFLLNLWIKNWSLSDIPKCL